LSNTCSIIVSMSSLATDRLRTQTIGPAAPLAPSWRLTAGEEATAVAELKQAAAGLAVLLAECAGLALGYGEHQCDAARYRQIADLCIAAGIDETLIEAWIEVGRQRASTARPSPTRPAFSGRVNGDILPATRNLAHPAPT
jgi:hypothetical protein